MTTRPDSSARGRLVRQLELVAILVRGGFCEDAARVTVSEVETQVIWLDRRGYRGTGESMRGPVTRRSTEGLDVSIMAYSWGRGFQVHRKGDFEVFDKTLYDTKSYHETLEDALEAFAGKLCPTSSS